MNMQLKRILVTDSALNTALGLESMGNMDTYDTNPNNTFAPLQEFSPETQSKLRLICKLYKIPAMESIGHIPEEMIVRDTRSKTSESYQKAAREHSTNAKKYTSLPQEIRNILDPMRAVYTAMESVLAEAGVEKTSFKARSAKYKKDQAQQAMESILFQMLVNTDVTARKWTPRPQDRPAMESYSYQNAIYYPKLEALTQWVNVAATIYQKVMRVKQLLNPVTSIPVHTQRVEIQFNDENGKPTKTIRREALYNKFMNEDALEAYDANDRDLTLKSSDFGYYIDMETDKVWYWGKTATGTPAEAIKSKERLRTDFMVVEVVFADGAKTGAVYDPRSGLMKSVTYNEADLKGKTVEIFHPTDAAAGKDRKNAHTLAIDYNPQERKIKFAASKTTTATSTIASIVVNFKIVDIAMEMKSNKEYNIITERSFITAGPFRRETVHLNQTELEIIDQRQQGNFLNKITNLIAESIVHVKDYTFFKGVNDMVVDLKAEYAIDPTWQLYLDQEIDMSLENSVLKTQDLNLSLGHAFQNLITTFNLAANTQTDVQMNMYCHAHSILPISPSIKHITGEVTEASNGQFLGVQQDARVSVITLGQDASTPVSSIVCSTDKLELRPKRAASNLPGDTEYDFHILPTFAETNVETTLFTETPTRVISDNAIRSAEWQFIPAMIMDYSANVSVLRAAYGKLTVKGYYAHTV